ncbi:MAG TPA: oligopeptide transporter, OPT family [Ferruginibacter sp.]|jgi:putative OPT family oligopeptide transporter|nr:oligopeptide transporter, OPT family [Ferruginibacter sp.]MBN8699324.1 oligopeptide transporter, OPT family [Chitinophagales bacterium]HNA01011.1 oligopeptide transporter, OPT family [Ferruginibacter sp.]HNO99809.1 oligopeptide transporter, OPT family [Ferruginibacter sp.]HQR01018.1 oligopeptide transporter, OPT family [Ferruginibacter sp.]
MSNFQPFIPADMKVKEFTLKSVLLGAFFGVIFGMATVYLALKAGLTVSASIPIAVIAISLGRKLFKTTILENNIIQTTGSAGESIAAGVVFTLPGFLFLSDPTSADYFNYITIMIIAMFGGMLGTLMMVPLRRSLIVKEHGTLPYPEGTACASVLKAGEKGGDLAKTAFLGMGFALAYAILQKIFHVIAEVPEYATKMYHKAFPAARVHGEITPEYMGVGYIIGPRISGILVAGGVMSAFVLIPLLASLVPADVIFDQINKLGLKPAKFGWDAATHTFANPSEAIYRAYIRQIGAGAVAAGGFITLIKTIPTIISSFKESIGGVKNAGGDASVARTEKDLNIKWVLYGSLALVAIVAILPMIPGQGIVSKLLLGVLIVIFGAFFVTVSSRIVGLIGSSNNPISGMTIATIMATCLVFLGVGWSGKAYEPMALVVGGMICVAAANAGATSQDLKTGYIVGATPRYQQLALFVGAIVSAIVVGFTIKYMDTPTSKLAAQGIQHAIGEEYAAPQATLMATLIKGIMGHNLDWNFVLVGVFIAIFMELCGIKALSFAVGSYLPLSTTLPIFIGGFIRGVVDKRYKGEKDEEEDLRKGNLFATGLVAGGALAGVLYAILKVPFEKGLESISLEHQVSNGLGAAGYQVFGVICFAAMGFTLYRVAMSKKKV